MSTGTEIERMRRHAHRRRWTPMITLAASLVVAVCRSAPVAAVAPDDHPRPSILILMAEDMSPRVGAFGDPVASTPNIDALADEGTRFTQAFTTAGVCAPSRAAHITGMNQVSFGGQHMRTRSFPGKAYRTVPPAEVKAYPELLRRAGYYTFTNHKLDYQFSDFGAGSGPFTIWDYEGREPDWKGRAPGQPFFGLVNFGSTHESQLFTENVDQNRAAGRAAVTDPDEVAVPPYYPDTPVVRQTLAHQYDNIHFMDAEVGRWLERLRAEGLLENTIVIWTTDHGDGLPRAKREIYDSGIHVPLVVRWPTGMRGAGKAAGTVDDRLLSFVDIGPSALQWAGATIPEWMQGLPVLADDALQRQYVYAAKDRLDEFPFRERVVRDRRFKYLLNFMPGEPGAKHLAYRDRMDMMQELWSLYDEGRLDVQQSFWFEPRPREELYDLQSDPHEVHNLADDPAYAVELERLRAAYQAWYAKVGDYSDMPEEQMAQQFWPEGIQPVTDQPGIERSANEVTLTCPTDGASIAYRLDGGPWRIYTGPFDTGGAHAIEARAVRYGWAGSETVSLPLQP